MKTYLFSYPYKRDEYSLEIAANTREEAEGRFKAILWGRYDGELQCQVKVAVPVKRALRIMLVLSFLIGWVTSDFLSLF